MKKIFTFVVAIIVVTVSLVGCSGNNNTVQTCLVSNINYTSQSDLESASQPEMLNANEPIYASIHFVESPKGVEYTVKWYLDETEIESETKATEKDTHDILVYELTTAQAVEGKLKLEVTYNDNVLTTKELEIK